MTGRSAPPRDHPALYLLIAGLAAAVFLVDLSTPVGPVEWVVYAIPLTVALFASRPLVPVVVGPACSALVLCASVLSPPQPNAAVRELAELNRGIACATLLALAGIGRQLVATKGRVAAADWVRAAQVALNARLRGEQTPEELGRAVLAGLAELLEARVGAVHLADGDAFQLRGGFAVPEEPRPAGVGPGLVERAVAERRLVVVRDVPAGYLDVRSSLGRAAPACLVLLPATADGRVLAVFELGFFSPPPPPALELLESMAEPVGIALRSAQLRRRQAELHDEARRQAEELQAQQHELETTNEELEEQHAALEDANARLEAQRDELLRARAALTQRSGEVERASRYKSEFLAHMSHELRTPLNSTLILARLLADNRSQTLTAEQVKYAESIYSAGNDLLTLINDILDLSKVEAGVLELQAARTSLARLVARLQERFEPLALRKGLRLAVEVDPACPDPLDTDEHRLLQIVSNLLSNAVEFTERGSVTLRVACAATPGRLTFEVSDTGPGIPPDRHDAIFDAFRQGGLRRHGAGLGLAISRELARLLGGDIRVVSAPGQGSRFILELPASLPASVAPPASAPPAATQPALAIRTFPAPALEDDRDRLGGGPALLVIEDDPIFAGILRDLAREHGFRVVVAAQADEGLRLARELRPAAMVLDIGLPDHSGLTVLELIKRDPLTRHTPVHIISVHDYRRVARELGAVGYSLKPVERRELVAAFEELARRAARPSRSVLVVEDDPIQREAIARLLSNDRVTVVDVPGAEAALARLRRERFDCLVLDLMLRGPRQGPGGDAAAISPRAASGPHVDGFELLEAMAAEERPLPPVIVYTARALSVEEEQRLRRYSRSIIVKGARSPERLLQEVTLFLHQAESELSPEKQRMIRSACDREAAFEGRRLLLVEDDVRNVFALQSLLEPRGATVEVARDGEEALARLGRSPPIDLVLMDLMLPRLDGLEATRRLRKEPRWATLPVIALTAKASPADRAACLEAGASDYIAKPIDPEKLLSLVRVWLPR